MGNKYYTPTIEEFHVGFEYETYELYETPNRWKINIFGEEHMELDHIVFLLMEHSDMIRVKYLDKEDIESLGFKWDGHDTAPEFYFHINPGYILKVYTGANEGVLIEKNGMFLFYGKLKNKSELKVLLKQLGIE